VEVGAYVTAAEAVRDAAARGASRVEISAQRTGDRLILAARHDGAGAPAPLVHVADRIGALGGTLAVDGHGIRAELPCG
jgi:hypothetical protein